MKKLSVVIPCYNEEEAVPLFYEAFLKENEGLNVEFEFVFGGDGGIRTHGPVARLTDFESASL